MAEAKANSQDCAIPDFLEPRRLSLQRGGSSPAGGLGAQAAECDGDHIFHRPDLRVSHIVTADRAHSRDDAGQQRAQWR